MTGFGILEGIAGEGGRSRGKWITAASFVVGLLLLGCSGSSFGEEGSDLVAYDGGLLGCQMGCSKSDLSVRGTSYGGLKGIDHGCEG